MTEFNKAIGGCPAVSDPEAEEFEEKGHVGFKCRSVGDGGEDELIEGIGIFSTFGIGYAFGEDVMGLSQLEMRITIASDPHVVMGGNGEIDMLAAKRVQIFIGAIVLMEENGVLESETTISLQDVNEVSESNVLDRFPTESGKDIMIGGETEFIAEFRGANLAHFNFAGSIAVRVIVSVNAIDDAVDGFVSDDRLIFVASSFNFLIPIFIEDIGSQSSVPAENDVTLFDDATDDGEAAFIDFGGGIIAEFVDREAMILHGLGVGELNANTGGFIETFAVNEGVEVGNVEHPAFDRGFVDDKSIVNVVTGVSGDGDDAIFAVTEDIVVKVVHAASGDKRALRVMKDASHIV